MRIEIKVTCECGNLMSVSSIYNGKYILGCHNCKIFKKLILSTEEIAMVSIHSGETVKFEVPVLNDYEVIK